MGAVLAGSEAFADQALSMRTAMSGEWRPIGPMAAGALAAIEGWRERLQRDHCNTREIAEKLRSKLGNDAVSNPLTNIILLHCPQGKAEALSAYTAEHRIRILPLN